MLYTFRILLDYEQDVFRDIQIKGNKKFLDLHNVIQDAFNFDNTQISSFYISDKEWNKGEEISMMDMAGEQIDTNLYSMAETTIDSIATKEGQKFIYVSDFFLMWCFFVEVVKISEPIKGEKYPKVSLSFGEAPDQYSKDADINFTIDETLPENLENDKEEDIFDRFNDFDDYR